MKKILITGANGFIGSFLVEEAISRGWDVWAGVRTGSNRVFLKHPDIHYIDINYADTHRLTEQLMNHARQYGRWDYIIHGAGITKGKKASDFDRVNHQYTRHLVDALIKTNLQPAQFLFLSSLGAFGPGDEQTYNKRSPGDAPNPNTAYGKSKIQAERYLQSLKDFPCIILRPTGVYGPREKDYLVLMKLVQAGLNVSMGFKPQMLSFIYVKDLVTVCFAALESTLSRKSWFVADGSVYTSEAFAEIIQEVLHRKRVFKLVVPLFLVKSLAVLGGWYSRMTGQLSLINPDKYRILKQRNWTCDTTNLQLDLGFQPAWDLRSGLQETIDWYRKEGWL